MVISFGHSDGQWKSKYSYSPKAMMNSSTSLFSKADGTYVYKHNQGDINSFYDDVTPSSIGIAFNQNPSSNKIFKSLSIEGSNTLANKSHLFTPKSSTDMPSESKIATTYPAKNMGGILYSNIERSDVLRNGATMHYVGDVLSIDKFVSEATPDGSDFFTSVTVDDSLSDYIPSTNVIYAFYIPEEDAFYFGADIPDDGGGDDGGGGPGDGGGGDPDSLDLCDTFQLYVALGTYLVRYENGNIEVSFPLPYGIGDDESAKVVISGEIDGQPVSFTSTEEQLTSGANLLLWQVPIETAGTWTVELIAFNEEGECSPLFLDSINLSEEQVNPGSTCEEFQNFDNYSISVIQPSPGSPNQTPPSDGAITLQFLSELGVAPYTVTLNNEYPDSYSDSGTIVSATWGNLGAGQYQIAVFDSNPSASPSVYDPNTEEIIQGCYFDGVGTEFRITLANPSDPFACNYFNETASQLSTYSFLPESEDSQILIPKGAFAGLDDTIPNDDYNASNVTVYALETTTDERIDMDFQGQVGQSYLWQGTIPSGTWTFIASVPSCEDLVFLASNQTINAAGGNCTALNAAAFATRAVVAQPSYTYEMPSTIEIYIVGPQANGGFDENDFILLYYLDLASDNPIINDNGQDYPASDDVTWEQRESNQDVPYPHIAIRIKNILPGTEDNPTRFSWDLYSPNCSTDPSAVYGVLIAGDTLRLEVQPLEAYDWKGAPFDSNYDGAIGTADLLAFLPFFGSLAGGVDPIYGVVPFDTPPDGSVSTTDLLELLSAYGDQDEGYINQYVTGDDPYDPNLYGQSPAQFFEQDESGNWVPIEGSPYAGGSGARLKRGEALGRKQVADGLVAFEDLDYASNLPVATIGVGDEEGLEDIVKSISDEGSVYSMFNTNSEVQEYLLGLEDKQVQLFAFKDYQQHGDDHRGQTSELQLNLGSDDFELFAVNLNYEMANADHSK